jgi:hypothetical protein
MIQIKVERESYVNGFYAFDEKQGLDFDWTGDGWKSCGSKIGTGKTIQEAIEDFLDKIDAELDVKYTWS